MKDKSSWNRLSETVDWPKRSRGLRNVGYPSPRVEGNRTAPPTVEILVSSHSTVDNLQQNSSRDASARCCTLVKTIHY